MTIPKNELPEGLSPEARARLLEGRGFETLEDEAENVYQHKQRGADGQHGWDVMLYWEPVTNIEMLLKYIEFAGYESVEEFKREEVFRANVDRPDMEWLRDL